MPEFSTFPRVVASAAASELLARLGAIFGPLMVHLTEDEDGLPRPRCYAEDEFLLGPGDVFIGAIGDVPFYVASSRHEARGETHVELDVASGRAGLFSLESREDVRFVAREREFTAEERRRIPSVALGCPDGGPGELAARHATRAEG